MCLGLKRGAWLVGGCCDDNDDDDEDAASPDMFWDRYV